MTAPVFLVPQDELAALVPGALYRLDGPEGRHAAVVQRRGVGERIDLVDGESGRRATTTVASVEGDVLALRVDAVADEPVPDVRLVLVQALAKGERDDQAVEAATELGVDAIVPWQAARSIVQWRGDRGAKAHAKWVKVAQAATKQSRRARTPEVRDLVATGRAGGLAALVRDVVAHGGAVLVLHEDAVDALSAIPAATYASVARAHGELLVVVGPEGGIGSDELAELTEAGAVAVVLGSTVLRASSAGPAALAILNERTGRW